MQQQVTQSTMHYTMHNSNKQKDKQHNLLIIKQLAKQLQKAHTQPAVDK